MLEVGGVDWADRVAHLQQCIVSGINAQSLFVCVQPLSRSYVLFDNVMWTATSGQVNKWRRNTMKIGNTDMGHLAQSKITFIYNFSPVSVVGRLLALTYIFPRRLFQKTFWAGQILTIISG